MGSDFLKKKQDELEGAAKKQTDYLANTAKNLEGPAEMAYRRKLSEFESFKNLGYDRKKGDVKKAVEMYMKGQEKRDMEIILYKIETGVNKGKLITYGYKQAVDTLLATSEAYNEIMNDSVRKHGNPNYIAQLQEKRGRYQKKLEEYQQSMQKVKEDLIELQNEGLNKLGQAAQRLKKGGGSNIVPNIIVIGLTAAFGGSVIYALSNISLSNTSTGAFAAAPVLSPMLLMTVAGTVIFFLFLATHHKLEQHA